MLIRVVTMTFEESKVDEFLQLFDGHKNKIRSFPGCEYLELWRDIHQKNVFYTYSHWINKESLESYRCSPLFEGVWSKTKRLFKEKAQAFSAEQSMKVDP